MRFDPFRGVVRVHLVLACTCHLAKSAEPTNAPRHLLYAETVVAPEGGPATHQVLLLDGWRFRFIPPPQWTVKYDPETKVVAILAPNLEAGINVRIRFEPDGPQSVSDAGQFLAEILLRYEGARNIRRYNRPVAGTNCLGFDFERSVEKDVPACFRLIRVPFTGGVIEFEMNAAAGRFSGYNQTFNLLLSSFQIQPSGAP